MTVIAWDGKTMAADKQTSMYGAGFTTSKLHRVADKLIWGACGDSSLCREMADWIKAGRDPAKLPARFGQGVCEVLVVESDGTILLYDNSASPTVIEEEEFAIGSGAAYALGAMYAGYDAQAAVLAASHFSNSCGRGLDTITHKEVS